MAVGWERQVVPAADITVWPAKLMVMQLGWERCLVEAWQPRKIAQGVSARCAYASTYLATSHLRGHNGGGPRALGVKAALGAAEALHVGIRRGHGACRAGCSGSKASRVVNSAGAHIVAGCGRGCSAADGRGWLAPQPHAGGFLALEGPAKRRRWPSFPQQSYHPTVLQRTSRLSGSHAGGVALALRVGPGEEQHAEVADHAGNQADADHPAAGVQLACGGRGSGGVWGRPRRLASRAAATPHSYSAARC